MDHTGLESEIDSLQPQIRSVFSELHRVIVGQEEMLEGIMIALMTKGNLLIEGLPGLAKSLAVSTYAKISELSFHRIQFTPDLLPGDITGTLIFNMRNETFVVEKGPIFAHFILEVLLVQYAAAAHLLAHAFAHHVAQDRVLAEHHLQAVQLWDMTVIRHTGFLVAGVNAIV